MTGSAVRAFTSLQGYPALLDRDLGVLVDPHIGDGLRAVGDIKGAVAFQERYFDIVLHTSRSLSS